MFCNWVLKSEIFFFSASIWKWFLFIFYFLCIWSGLNEMWFVCRRKVGVSEHQEEGQWSQMPSYWEENPRGMPFLWLFDSSLVSVVSVLMCRYCVYLNLLLYVGVSNMAGYWVLLRFQPFDDGDVLDFGF